MIKGVVFDFNGTLFWDTKLHNLAWDAFLDRHAIQLTDAEKNRVIHGKNNGEILRTLLPGLSDADVHRFALEKETIYHALCFQHEMQLAPGAKPFIRELKENQIPYTIATASGKENIDFYFDHYGLGEFFDKSDIVYDNGKLKSKPDPEIYLKAIQMIGSDASETLVFEDSIAGITAAENARVGSILIVNSNEEDYSHWSHPVITSFDEVDRSILGI